MNLFFAAALQNDEILSNTNIGDKYAYLHFQNLISRQFNCEFNFGYLQLK